MISLDEALAIAVDTGQPIGTETIDIGSARGRTLAGPVIARIAAPSADSSAMDGYAVRQLDATPGQRLRLVGESSAGAPWSGSMGVGEAVRIFTGATVPDGADWVVIQENVRREGDMVEIVSPGSGGNIRPRASDFEEGDVLLPVGTTLGPRELVTAAGADVDKVIVYVRPKVAQIGTGSELAAAGSAHLTPGAVPESLLVGLSAWVEDEGAALVSARRVVDDLPALEQAAGEALRQADLVIVTGGASVGDHDHARAMFAPFGLDLLIDKVAMKPGKPVWLGRAGGRLVIGLPGNPTSAMVTARLLLIPLLRGLCGRNPAGALEWMIRPAATDFPAVGARETLLRARLDGDGVAVLANQDSSSQKTLAAATCLVRRRANSSALPQGSKVEVLPF